MIDERGSKSRKAIAIECLTEQIRQFDTLASTAGRVGVLLQLATPLALLEGFYAAFRHSVELIEIFFSRDEAFQYVKQVITAHRYIDYELWDAVADLFCEEAATIEAELFEKAKREQELNKALEAFLKGFREAPFPVREIQTCREQLHVYTMKIIHIQNHPFVGNDRNVFFFFMRAHALGVCSTPRSLSGR